MRTPLATLLLLVPAAAGAADFYVSPTGNDANAGTSGAPWQTIAKVNGHAFAAGDRVLFQGGQTFSGSLGFDASDAGTAASPVVVTSYGTGRATISSTGSGIYVHNAGGFEVRDLIVVGPGRATSTASGVSFYCDLGGGVKLAHLVIDHVDVSGFRTGIDIGSWNSSLSGYSGVSVTNCASHDNARAGMSSWGYFTATTGVWSHQNWYVGHCAFVDNPGDPAYTANHSGNGIVLGEVDNVTIERCVARGNGALSAHIGGGPVGIWAYDSNHVTIQLCESHHNHCGSSVDGGGFDLDGGSTDSVMQYNWSHDNDGAGYLVGDYSGSRPTSTNTVRYNISQNDGRQHGYGGVQVYAGSTCLVHGNTLYMSPAASGTPAALLVTGGSGLKAWNNCLVSSGGARLANVIAGTVLQGNSYWPSGGAFVAIVGGTTYGSLTALHGAGIEKLGGADVGVATDPLLTAAGTGGSIDNADNLGSLTAYQLQSGSPLIDAGLDLATLFGVAVGARDYYADALPQGSAYDIGAHERPAAAGSTTGGTTTGTTTGGATTGGATTGGTSTGGTTTGGTSSNADPGATGGQPQCGLGAASSALGVALLAWRRRDG
jgi:hypothetical protein